MHTTYANIDLAALAHNLSNIRERLHQNCQVMAVVKANAYGHGAVEVSRALIQQNVTRLAVASVEEGVALRKAGITAEILVLVDLFQKHVEDLLAYRLTPVVTDQRILPLLAKSAAEKNLILPIHIKVDTGMGRLGFSPSDIGPLFDALPSWKSLRVQGLMTHLADSDGEDSAHAEQQLAIFQELIDQLKRRNISVPIIHAANSASLVRFPQSHYSMVRPGIMLYGYHTLPSGIPCPDLKPVLSLRSTVVHVRTIRAGGSVSYNRTFVAKRPTRIAVVPIGYADGYSRRLSNNGFVLIGGKKAPVVGIVCMDMTMVDTTDIGGIQVGDTVTLIGQDGRETIGADDLAEWTGTIPYEVLCAIGSRVPRLYQAA